MSSIHPAFHVSLSWQYNPDTIQQQQQKPPPAIEIEGEKEWEVEAILDSQRWYNKIKQHCGTHSRIQQQIPGCGGQTPADMA
ncbi:hypothetical protein CROQUDRAFT_100054 [Cronartium quercuum f. sp. fusiforme G11]|uniref:Uncharacterized protein n=1 Tax=Cronartium quercuum f. sp. fusiforme G11 TaxID=708437 RepID=A0A9P6T6K1_9BASI|nr:hypothetical protein CROQUDRAFT_100054 [Cronartium quercuum f. sp. fusiforme G11]